MKQKSIIIIRGAPASGKSTLARGLVSALKTNGKISLLIPDEFKWVMTAHDNRDEHDFALAFSNYRHVLKSYLDAGYLIITEDTWDAPPFETSTIVALAEKYKYTCYQLLLTGSWETIKHRNTLRPMVVPVKQLQKQYSTIYSITDEEETVIDTDKKSPKKILQEALSHLQY